MLDISVTISGKTPLLVNRFHEEAQLEASNGHHARKEKLTPEEDATMRLYQNENGLYFPAENLRQGIIAAGGRHKIGRKSASYDLAAALYVTPETLPLQGAWKVDSRPVVIPATKGRILRHRPFFESWTIEFTLVIDQSLIDAKLVREVLDDAGNYVGIGDFRPARRGPYGRFAVTHWQEVRQEAR